MLLKFYQRIMTTEAHIKFRYVQGCTHIKLGTCGGLHRQRYMSAPYASSLLFADMCSGKSFQNCCVDYHFMQSIPWLVQAQCLLDTMVCLWMRGIYFKLVLWVLCTLNEALYILQWPIDTLRQYHCDAFIYVSQA